MGNTEIIKAVTENLHTVLRGLGIKFSAKSFDDSSAIPAGMLPLGRIFYNGEGFESTHGERAAYITAAFTIEVVLKGSDPKRMIATEQEWVHNIKEAISVNALNIGTLTVSKEISRVDLEAIEIENREGFASLSTRVSVRYREA